MLFLHFINVSYVSSIKIQHMHTGDFLCMCHFVFCVFLYAFHVPKRKTTRKSKIIFLCLPVLCFICVCIYVHVTVHLEKQTRRNDDLLFQNYTFSFLSHFTCIFFYFHQDLIDVSEREWNRECRRRQHRWLYTLYVCVVSNGEQVVVI